ncbi:hypothetical protein H6501_01650 [Candidatus Woesearchaeota archaeon]|nr:hypothetical protein [Candidatus Woesearchaeota archaeon]USN44805.1 MAG: hypothetical protein H6500_03100 [Candidatus Woesearchaeota archaeon]
MVFWKHFSTIVLIFFFLPCVLALDLDDLLDSYDYDFNSSLLNIESVSDSLVDTTNDTLLDQLNILVHTNLSNSSYYVIVSLDAPQSTLVSYTNLENSTATLSFPTEDIIVFPAKYSVEVRDESFNLLSLRSNLSTGNYSTYDLGPNISVLSDSNFNNESLDFSFLVTAPSAKETTITLTLQTNSSQSLEYTQNISLSAGSQTLTVSIPAEQIFNTHSTGPFFLETIALGNKLIFVNYTSLSYTFSDFASDSYISNFSSVLSDEDNNSLYDFLNLNFEIESFDAQSYLLSFALYDEEQTFILRSNKSLTASLGTQTIEVPIDTRELHGFSLDSLKVTGVQLLRQGVQVDSLPFPLFIENISSVALELPDLPDLTLSLTSFFNTSLQSTQLFLEVKNQGLAPAFNSKLEIFSSTFENTTLIPYLASNESLVFTYSIPSDSEGTLYTALIDIQNLVEESNESNNIVQSYSLSGQNSNIRKQITVLDDALVELILQNDNPFSLTSFAFSFANLSVSTFTLAPYEKKTFLLPLSLELGQSYPFSLSSPSIALNSTFTYAFSNITFESWVLERNASSVSTIELILTNNEEDSISFTFAHKEYTLAPHSSVHIIKEGTWNESENLLSFEYSEKGLLKNYSLDLDVNPGYSFHYLDNSLVEILLNNTHAYPCRYSFDFQGRFYTFTLETGKEKKILLDTNEASQITNFQELRLDIFENFSELDSGSLYEIILNNSYSVEKNLSFTLGSHPHFFTLLGNERKVLLLEEEENQLLRNIELE